MSKQEITLLLIGRTGHGKSSTGNSILGEKVFPPRGITSDVTDPVEVAKREIDGKTVRVVDGSNIGETDDEYPDNAKEIISLSDEAFKLCNKRFNALVLLLKYGIRFTKQERDAVLVIKSLFGSDVIQRCGVIVMTGGDQFAEDTEDNGITFRQWCDQQSGHIHTLMKECDQRVVLFNNKTQDMDTLRTQRKELMVKVKEILNQTLPYTEEDWEGAEQGRKKLLVMTMMPEMEEETDDFIKEMMKQIDVLRHMQEKDPYGNLTQVTKLLGGLQQFEDKLNVRDEGTGTVTRLVEKLNLPRIKLKKMYGELEQEVYPGTIKVQPSKSGHDTHTHGSWPNEDSSDEVERSEKDAGICCFGCCGRPRQVAQPPAKPPLSIQSQGAKPQLSIQSQGAKPQLSIQSQGAKPQLSIQ